METKAPPRGVVCGRSYLGEEDAIHLIRRLRDGVYLFNYFLPQVHAQPLVAGRITHSLDALIRVVRELEDALGNSADE